MFSMYFRLTIIAVCIALQTDSRAVAQADVEDSVKQVAPAPRAHRPTPPPPIWERLDPTSPSPGRKIRTVLDDLTEGARIRGIRGSGGIVPKPQKVPSILPPYEMRNWSDNTGRFSITARLLAVMGTHVKLFKESGEITTVPIRRLSVTDKAYVHLATKPPENKPPARPVDPGPFANDASAGRGNTKRP